MPCQEFLDGEHLRWRWTNPLGACIYNTYDEVAIVFGLGSMFFWTIALMPQIILNWQNGSAENQSLMFWGLWIVGDIMNLGGCILAHEIVTNTGLAIVYFFFTCVCFGQFIYYNMYKATPEHRQSVLTSTPRLPMRPGASPSMSGRKNRQGVTLSPLRKRKNYGSTLASASMGLVQVAGAVTHIYASTTSLERRRLGSAETTGIILGWAMCAVYTCSRVPQIALMIREQNADGISPYFFFLTFSGNMTQFLAMTVKESLTLSYILFNLPWLLSASVCAVEDVFVVALYYKIQYDQKKKPEAQDDEEVSFLTAG